MAALGILLEGSWLDLQMNSMWDGENQRSQRLPLAFDLSNWAISREIHRIISNRGLIPQ